MLSNLFGGPNGPALESLVAAQDGLLTVVPVGLTVVARGGAILHVNGYQQTLQGCPWADDHGLNLCDHAQVPAPLRTGLRRLFDGASPTAPVQLPPFTYPERDAPLETWLVGVAAAGLNVAAVILQHDRSPAREGCGLPAPRRAAEPGTRSGLPDLAAPPALDLARLQAAFDITERELQIVDALCRGHRTPRIAQDMHISGHTVKDHVKRIQRKMGAQNRLTIVARALLVSLH